MINGRFTLGEFLAKKKYISESQLQTARLESDKTGESLGHVLIRLGIVPEEKITEYYVDHCGIPKAGLKKINPQVLHLIPEDVARRYNLIPLEQKGKKLTIVMSDPLNIIVKDEIKFRTGLDIEVHFAGVSEIEQAFTQFYGTTGSVGDILKTIDMKSVNIAEDEAAPEKLQRLAEEAPVIKLVNTFITQAFKNRASDLHLEPDENVLRIRHRIDGVLYDVATLPKYLQSAVISRAKIMSDLNIAIKRAPQDGRFQINIEGNPIDVRVSSFPTVYGENIVMRLLDARSILMKLEEIGLTEENTINFKELLQSPYGIVLVTGPTGCGKTTTLYSALNFLNSPKKNIMTVEDPVEYRLFGIRQAQINPKGGLTFASGLRSILRQDPDIIMVGEIRDLETAEVAVHSALTGHLVLSTLHTNDAPSALTRLIDMGIEPFLIPSSVIGVLAQRLVRALCKECKEAVKPTPEMLAQIGTKQAATIYNSKGCAACKEIGFKGRTGIFEFLTMNDELKELVLAKSPASALKAAAERSGMKNLRKDGMDKVLKGVTTIDEILQVTMVR